MTIIIKAALPCSEKAVFQLIESEATKQALGEFFPDLTTLFQECCQSCGFSKQHDLHWLEQCDIPHRVLSFCLLPAFSRRRSQMVTGAARYRWLVSLAIRLNCSSRLTHFNAERAPVPASHMRV
ncbi:hypothetical protein B9Z19DRAFT_452903 [Tuber borchii]|uniref:Uncharacterized protein n=1 Tax=Tuber borchii TaxID=42251 RepID=A0A2T6ZFX6_TUBBO|nr:hypothetical protein B9Z19DRAFT_452903 [Tuber borchii]